MTRQPTLGPDRPSRPFSVTWRAGLLGIGLSLLMAVLTPFNDYIAHNTFLIGNHLPLFVVFVITVLCVVVNPLLGRRRLRQGELIVAVGMMLLSCALPSSGFYRYFFPLLADSVYLAGQSAIFPALIHQLPAWMLPVRRPNSGIVSNFYLGFAPGHGGWKDWAPMLAAWAKPLAMWSLFVLPMFGAIMFFVLIMRKQWVNRERLPFPLAAIPLEMMADPEGSQRLNWLWRSGALWIAAAIPFLIEIYNGATYFGPFHSLPQIPTAYNISQDFTQFPWTTLPWSIQANRIYFSVVGVTFFVPTEIAFSIWFMYLAYNLGWAYVAYTGQPYNMWGDLRWQAVGFYAVYGVITFWIVRRHLGQVLRAALKLAPREADEFLPYWLSTLGFLLCLGLATTFLMLAGLNWWLGLLTVGLLLFYCMVITRVIAEAGLLMVDLNSGPFGFLGALFSGTSALTLKQWLVTKFSMAAIYTDGRENLMPFTADVLRMGSDGIIRRKHRYMALLAVALLACLLVSGGVNMYLSYTYGRAGFDGYSSNSFPWGTLAAASRAAHPGTASQTPLQHLLEIGQGAVAMAVVAGSRLLFAGSPLHPIGLLLLNSYAMNVFWFSIFVGWLLKVMILRWGGAEIYRRARPFFIGLIVGEALAAVFWMMIGFSVGWPTGRAPFVLLPL